MSELNTQLPTSVELCGKPKWEVRRTRSLGNWKARNHNAWESRYFDTWREAMDYADRKARTREVVLPRQLNTKRPVGTTKKYWEVAPHVGTQNVLIRRRREDGHICQQVTVNRKDLGLLAPMLLAALAEQEAHQ